jgi:hypothetical protein
VIGRRSGFAVLLASACVVVAAISEAPAGAQLQLGGSVPILIALSLGSPTPLRRLPAGDVYELSVPVHITSTVGDTQLSLADGEDFSGPARGHLHDGSRLVSAPLEVALRGRPPQALSAPTDPILGTWSGPLTLSPETVEMLQRLPQGTSSGQKLHKLVWITISSDTP